MALEANNFDPVMTCPICKRNDRYIVMIGRSKASERRKRRWCLDCMQPFGPVGFEPECGPMQKEIEIKLMGFKGTPPGMFETQEGGAK